MSKLVTLYLGPAIGLSSRRLVISRLPLVEDEYTLPPAAQYVGTLAGTTTSVAIVMPQGVWQARLRDYKTTGEESDIDVLNFQSGGDLQFPGPRSKDRLSVYCIEDVSSSSSSSSSSVSTSSASSHSSS